MQADSIVEAKTRGTGLGLLASRFFGFSTVRPPLCAPAAVFFVIAFTAACALCAEPGLVARYTFEEGSAHKLVKDWSGHGNDGTVTGNVTYVRLPGAQGYALRFDDGRAYVNCGKDPSLNLTDAATIELWVYPETGPVSGTEPGLAGKGFSSYVLTYAGSCWWYIGSTGNAVSGGGVHPTSSWYHVAATFDGKDSKLYIDGALAGRHASAHDKIPTSTDAFYLRYPVLYGSDKDLPFTCMMDDVRVYNRALSADVVLRRYREERNWRKGRRVEAGRMSVTPRVYARLAKLRVAVDFAGLQPIPDGTVLTVELLAPATGQALARYETAQLPDSDRFVAVLDTSEVPAGDYEVRTAATDGEGNQVGSVSSVAVTLTKREPAPGPDESARALNNLVTELLSVRTPARRDLCQYRFTNPRDGWVFISSDADAGEEGEVRIVIDSVRDEDAAIVHKRGESGVLEAMRRLPAGEHTLAVRCAGAGVQQSLAVRAIPETVYAEIGYGPTSFLPGYGPYTWSFLEGIGLLDQLNVVLERHRETDPSEPYARRWRQQGKKLLTYSTLNALRSNTADAAYEFWSGRDGFQLPDRDGIMFDELSGDSHKDAYPGFGEAVRRLSENPAYRGRTLYPYCSRMYTSEPGTAFCWDIVEAGYKLAEEKYLPEQPTAAAAQAFLDTSLTQVMSEYQASIPDCQEHMIMCFGYMSAPPESLSTHPSVDYKVYLDMQFNLIANDPAFRGLYGVMCYHSAFTDEEIIRWSAKLFRHYCIEGRREMLSKDPYMLSHIRNPDFADGTEGWILERAEPGSMAVKEVPGYSYLQGRYPRTTQGETVLWAKRSAAAPNRFSQQISGLEPGRLYSLKMFTADHQRFVSGTGVGFFEATEAKREITIRIDGVDLIPAKSFRNTYASGRAGHSHGAFTRQNNLPITYHLLVFRARTEEAALTVSDWVGDADPGAPAGQELMFNFIEIQPYLED